MHLLQWEPKIKPSKKEALHASLEKGQVNVVFWELHLLQFKGSEVPWRSSNSDVGVLMVVAMRGVIKPKGEMNEATTVGFFCAHVWISVLLLLLSLSSQSLHY